MPWPIDIQSDTARVRIHEPPHQDPLPDLVALELSLGQQQIRSIILTFDPDTAVPADRLERLDYCQSAPGHYVKSIPGRRSVRFSITEKCNYKCFFCHEEGLQMDLAREDADEAQLFRVLDQLKAMGYNDFTFTGGEPLLKWREILCCLDYMQRIEYLPDIKLVSNGLALNPAFLQGLRTYPGKIRFNISMHSLDSATYSQITCTTPRRHDDLTQVQANLEKLREAGIPFKLNFVLLKGINTDPEQIDRIFAYASACGAQRIKFLELLITKKLKHLYPYFYRLQALKDQLGDQLSFLGSGQRRALYRYRDTPLQVELQSCTCSRGCNVCALNRDVNFTAELRYFPCFLHPEKGTDLKASILTDAVAAGADDISGMARHFGDHSPIIIRDHYLTSQEVAYYYEIAVADIERFVEQTLLSRGLELQRHRQLDECYFSDGSEAFTTFEYVRKLAINTYDHQAIEITQQHRIDSTGSGRIETAFGEASPAIASIEDYCHEMASHGFKIVLQTHWELDYYGSGEQTTSDLSFSLGQLPDADTALVRSSQPIHDTPCPLRPLTQPVPAWLATRTGLVDPGRLGSA